MRHGIRWFLGLTLFVAACNTTGTMELPEVKTADIKAVETPIQDQASFALSKVIANIRRGTTIANFPAGGVEGVETGLCNFKHDGESTIEWGAGSSFLGNWSTELGEIFYNTLAQQGLNIAGNPQDLFDQSKQVSSAEYRIGARITEMKGNFCELHHWWDARPLDMYSGEMYISVEWSVYSNLLKREVLTFNTDGYAKQKKAKRDGVILALHNSFASAAEQIVSNQKFIDIALRKVEEGDKFVGDELILRGVKQRRRAIEKDIDTIIPAVVTVRSGFGHGSGFVVSPFGAILTNEHVVGKAQNVAVVLSNGIELSGVVERRDAVRDVALIKVDLRLPNALSIRENEAQRLEKVYAVGTPILEGLKSTVTSGVVSGVRKYKKDGLVYIQADAAISPGNSGGPLLDRHGNVVGISVATILPGESQSLNLFIPIHEALETLKIKFVVDANSS